ncbi:fatty acyl-AMP ligase [Mycolicibacter icosiumassiliensis]|uniref:fatty acyl-AMP ligase n=1 Tax=Mycolicibacter icosiumassiliensis TaxID=1792835 RepID=UPI001F3AEDE0|nr:fatty acyl-AMP ligase [Mycolicibacter icosiumassiliensis]
MASANAGHSGSPITVPTADTLVELARQQAARYGEKAALSFSYHGDGRDGCVLTYRELDSCARAIGAALQHVGAAGCRVLVLCGPGLDGIAGIFGCWYAGAVPVPISQRVGPRLSAVIADVEPGFAVASPELPRSVRSAVDALAGSVRWCSTTDSDADAWVAPSVDADSIALIQYSAGSAHCPRGVVLTHENVMVNLEAITAVGWGDSRDVAVSWLPMHQPLGLIGAVLAGIYAGASTVLMAPSAFIARPMRWLEAISRYRATVTVAPDVAYRLCVQRSTPAQRAGLDVSCLSTAITGVQVQPVRAAAMGAFAEAFATAGFRAQAFLPVYGLAEATLVVAGGSQSERAVVRLVDQIGLQSGWALDADANDPGAVVVVGCGRPRQQVVIVDPDTRLECGPDEVGEIWVSGPGVARGYWGAPAQTDRIFEAFLAGSGEGPFLRTGDRGFLWGEELFITGRCPDLVVLGGVHYYPNALEATVQDCHSVLLSGRGAVFADESEKLVVVQEVSCPVGEAELATLVPRIQSALLESYGVQADSIVLVAPMGLPTTPSGEIRRAACRWQYLDGDLDTLAHWHAPGPAHTPREANVVELTEGVTARRQRVCHS